MEEQYETIKWTCPPVTKGPFFFFFSQLQTFKVVECMQLWYM